MEERARGLAARLFQRHQAAAAADDRHALGPHRQPVLGRRAARQPRADQLRRGEGRPAWRDALPRARARLARHHRQRSGAGRHQLADDQGSLRRKRDQRAGADEARRPARGSGGAGGLPGIRGGGLHLRPGDLDRRGHDMKVIAVIPAFNEAATIHEVASRALAQLADVIVVDDGSSDGTAGALADLPVMLISNPSNLGKGASLWRGFAVALTHGADAIVTLDGDAQHRPEDIPRLIAAASEHPGRVIIGARLWDKGKVPPLRYFGNRFANFWVAWAAGCSVSDSQSGFRLYPASLLRKVRVAHGPTARFAFESEILIEAGRAGVRSVAVPIAAIYPPNARASHYRSAVDTARIVRMIAWKLFTRGFDLPALVRSLNPAKT